MSFLRPIDQRRYHGLDVTRIDVPLTVISSGREAEGLFTFDTGCQITTVSEDIATALGIQGGGRRVNVRGSTAGGTGRLVGVRFRFPRTVSGAPGLEVDSTWIVSSGRRGVALLSLTDVHRHFQLKLHEFDAYFIRWPAPR